MNKFDKYCGMHAWIPAPNLSHGFHGIIFQYIKEHYVKGQSLLMIAENANVNYLFEKEFQGILISNNCYQGEKGEVFIDLNLIQNWTDKYDFVLSQALFEHVSRPCVALENMSNVTKVGGKIIIHTQNPEMDYHAVPIDCLRFFKDWFVNMQTYLPIRLIEWNEFGPHLFCMYERI